MGKANIDRQIEGYEKIQREIKILRKYAPDPSAEKGQVARVVNQLHPQTLKLKVAQIRKETASATTFRLTSQGRYLPPFQAGQYINIFVEIDGVRTSRPYSISSPPNQRAYYDISVRRVSKGFVSEYLLNEVKVGDSFETTSPAGQFYHNPLFHGEDLVFIAGGSGITPFMSMIREIADRGLSRRVELLYGSRRENDIIFKDEMFERASHHENLTIHTIISEPSEGYKGLKGFITADLILNLVSNIDSKMIYLCGPEAMYTFVLAELKKLNIPKRKIRLELFGPPTDVTKQKGWPDGIHINSSFNVKINDKKTIAAKAGEPLMISLERTGVTIPTSCRSGECSLCRTKLLSGKVFQPDSTKIRKSDKTFGYIHPCMAYPLEDLEILI